MGAAPSQLREAVGGYVRALHAAYFATLGHGPAPAGPDATFQVAVVAAGSRLHLVGTFDDLPAGPPAVPDGDPESFWQLRFFDATSAPDLIPPGEPTSAEIESALRISHIEYHLVLGPGSKLDRHHAMHAGSGLAANVRVAPPEAHR
jgi:hypothetical protein